MTSTSSATSSPIASTGPASPRPSSSSREPTASSSRCRACRTPNRSATSSARPAGWISSPSATPRRARARSSTSRNPPLFSGEQVDSAAIGADPNTNARVVTFVLEVRGRPALRAVHPRPHGRVLRHRPRRQGHLRTRDQRADPRRTRPDHLRLHRRLPAPGSAEPRHRPRVRLAAVPDRGAGQHDDQPHARRRVPAAEPHRRSHRDPARHRVHAHPLPAAGRGGAASR